MSSISMEQLKAQLAALQAENDALKARSMAKVSIKQGKPHTCLDGEVIPTALFSVYGLGRFPTSLYEEQWKTLIKHGEDILKAIEQAHKDGKMPTPAQVEKMRKDKKDRKVEE